MRVSGRDQIVSLATSENSRLLSACGSRRQPLCYQRFYIGNMARYQFICIEHIFRGRRQPLYCFQIGIFNRGRVKNLLKEVEASIRTYTVGVILCNLQALNEAFLGIFITSLCGCPFQCDVIPVHYMYFVYNEMSPTS